MPKKSKRVGRPKLPKGVVLSEIIQVRLTKKQRALVKKAAKVRKLSVSRYVLSRL